MAPSGDARAVGADAYERTVGHLRQAGVVLSPSELNETLEKRFGGGFDEASAAGAFGRFMLGTGTDDILELTHADRERIFNLGYYTWVEQQGVSVEDFSARAEQSFWHDLRDQIPVWDQMIDEMNARTEVLAGL